MPHSVAEALGGGGGGHAELVHIHSHIHSFMLHSFTYSFTNYCCMSSVWETALEKQPSGLVTPRSPWEGEGCVNMHGPEARTPAPDCKQASHSAKQPRRTLCGDSGARAGWGAQYSDPRKGQDVSHHPHFIGEGQRPPGARRMSGNMGTLTLYGGGV